jgi:phage anti-repressor protein
VDARRVHAWLESKQDFTTWLKNRISEYSFQEGIDFCSIILGSKTGHGGHNRTDYAITLSMAKELCMVERNDQGKKARQYFIECERPGFKNLLDQT